MKIVGNADRLNRAFKTGEVALQVSVAPQEIVTPRLVQRGTQPARNGFLPLTRTAVETVRHINAVRGTQFSLPIPGITQLVLPLVGRVAAGSPILAQEHVDQTYHLEPSLFAERPDYLLRVRGMSMRDAGIMDGDLLAVQSARDARNGQIVVARLGDDVTVKRFHRHKNQIELHAENPDYPTIVVQPGDPFEIEGRAVGLIRNSMLM